MAKKRLLIILCLLLAGCAPARQLTLKRSESPAQIVYNQAADTEFVGYVCAHTILGGKLNQYGAYMSLSYLEQEPYDIYKKKYNCEPLFASDFLNTHTKDIYIMAEDPKVRAALRALPFKGKSGVPVRFKGQELTVDSSIGQDGLDWNITLAANRAFNVDEVLSTTKADTNR